MPKHERRLCRTLHVLAFGGLTGLVMLARLAPGATRPFQYRSVIFAAVVVMIWATIDELTQGIAGLGRHAKLNDYAADFLGVAIVAGGAALLFARVPEKHEVDG